MIPTYGKLIILIMPFWFIQNIYDYSYQKMSKGCIVAFQGDVAIDTLCVYLDGSKVFDNKQILEEIGGSIYKVDQKVPSIDNFSNAYISIEEWKLKKDKFNLESSLKIPLGNCYAKKLRIKLTEEGIKWKYKRGLFKKNLKGLIPYSKLKESNEYHLLCK